MLAEIVLTLQRQRKGAHLDRSTSGSEHGANNLRGECSQKAEEVSGGLMPKWWVMSRYAYQKLGKPHSRFPSWKIGVF